MIGTTLSHFQITAKLGEGGMGEVYRAEDTKLGREVAIKVLPEAVASDPERLARFEREAKVLASLNHPNIAAIYSFEAASDHSGGPVHFLIMELVEGEDLKQRLDRGPIPVAEALPLALQITQALEAAHERGIIHRDLKPANVKVTPDGKVKVLDFGLAKAMDPGTGGDSSLSPLSMSPTLTAQMTGAGVLLGTAAYMSPEQARGQEAGKQADIWAFGVVVWEMLCGQRLFAGPTVSDTLAEVLKTDPDLEALPEDVSPAVRRLLRRCLERDPRRRLRDIGDARLELEEAALGDDEESAPGVSEPPAKARRLLPWLAAAAVSALLIGFAAGRLGRAPATSSPTDPLHVSVTLPEGTRLTGHGSPLVALSPDGTHVAYVAEGEEGQFLYVQDLRTGQIRRIEGSDDAEGPFFSPDGEWIAFGAGSLSGPSKLPSELRKASLETGIAQTLCPLEDYFGGTWASDGTIYFSNDLDKGLWQVDAAGGEPMPIGSRDSAEAVPLERTLAWPEVLPGDRSLLATTWEGKPPGRIMHVDLGTGEVKDLGLSALMARYVPTGHLVLVSTDGTLSAVPFDLEAAETTGSPVALRQDIAIGGPSGPVIAVSPTGALLFAEGFVRGSRRELSQLVRISQTGTVEDLPFESADFVWGFGTSPDLQRLAVSTSDGFLWIYDLERGTRSKLPQGAAAMQFHPTWSPDGELIVSTGATERGEFGLFFQLADGSRAPEVLFMQGGEQWTSSFVPGTREVIFANWQGGARKSLRSLEIDNPSEPRILVEREEADVAQGYMSPDGRWLAYTSTRDAESEIMLRPYPELDSVVQVSAGGGVEPRWDPSRPGRLYYWGGEGLQSLMFVDLDSQGNPSRGQPLFDPALIAEHSFRPYYFVTEDGSIITRFRVPESGIVTHLHLVLDWAADLDRKESP